MSEEEIHSLVVSAQNGNWRAFEKLYQHFRDPLFRYCYWQVRDETAAEDIVAETLVTMLDSLHTFSGNGKFRNWLYTITKRKLMQYYRTKYEVIHTDNLDFLEHITPADLLEPDNTAEKKQLVDRLLSNVSQQEAAILRYRYEQNLSVNEVAKKTFSYTKPSKGLRPPSKRETTKIFE